MSEEVATTEVNPTVKSALENADYVVAWVKENPAATGIAAFALWWLVGKLGGRRGRRLF